MRRIRELGSSGHARVLGAVLLLLSSGPALALDPNRAVTQYGVSVWQDDRGLPQNTVYMLGQSRDGYLWIVTEETITRFDGVRSLNLRIMNRASIQVNTVPSGHAAGAFATALAVMSAAPAAGIVLLWLALNISIATVVGRYHYLLDTLLGMLVAIAVWSLV